MAEDTEQSSSNLGDVDPQDDVQRKIIDAVNLGVGASSMMIIKELKRIVEKPEIEKYIDRRIIVYISAAGALAYAGKDVYADEIGKLLAAVEIDADPDMLEFVHSMHLKNHLVYINAFNFLNFLDKEPTIDSVLDVIAALGAPPDAMTAGYVIEYMKEYMSVKYTTIDTGQKLTGRPLDLFKKLSSGNMELCALIEELIAKESEKIIKSKDVKANLNEEMLIHLAACETLAFSSRDVNSENIIKLMASVNITARYDYLQIIAKQKIKNQIIYLIALYFIIISEVEPTVDYLVNVVKAMNFYPDALTANYVIGIYKVKKLAGSFKWLKI